MGGGGWGVTVPVVVGVGEMLGVSVGRGVQVGCGDGVALGTGDGVKVDDGGMAVSMADCKVRVRSGVGVLSWDVPIGIVMMITIPIVINRHRQAMTQ